MAEVELGKKVSNNFHLIDEEINNVRKELNENLDTTEWIDILGTGYIKKKTLKKPVNGVRPSRGWIVTINLNGYLSNNTEVETFHQQKIQLGDWEVVRGLDIAISLMEIGETALVEVLPRFAYGDKGRDSPIHIPPNSTIMYKIEVVSGEEEPDIEKLSFEERRKIGSKKRERGNWWYSRDEYTTAIECYRRALEYLEEPSNASEENEQINKELELLLEDRLKIYSNMATAQFNNKAYDVALSSIEIVLRGQPNNVKALFRKGKILSAKGMYSEALSVFKEITALEPDNVFVKQELTRVQTLHNKDHQKVKDLYKKMLGGQENMKKTTKKPSHSKSGRSMALLVGGVAALAVAFVAYRYSTQFHD